MKQRMRVYGDGVRSRDERESLRGPFVPKTLKDGEQFEG